MLRIRANSSWDSDKERALWNIPRETRIPETGSKMSGMVKERLSNASPATNMSEAIVTADDMAKVLAIGKWPTKKWISAKFASPMNKTRSSIAVGMFAPVSPVLNRLISAQCAGKRL